MKKFTKIALSLLTTATVIQLDAGNFCPDMSCRMRRVNPPPPPPMNPEVTGFFEGLFAPYDDNNASYFVLGGSGNYSSSSYPQFALYDLQSAVYDIAYYDSDQFGGTSGYSVNNENFNRYFWGAYGGYHCPIHCGWELGLELGYKKVINTESKVDVVLPSISAGTPLLTPFRTTRTNVWDLLFIVKYQSFSGFNLFLKAGGAKVSTFLKEGNFLAPFSSDSDVDTLSGLNAFGIFSYSLTNIYPEVEIGAGFRFLNHFEIHLSYAKIMAPYENDLVSLYSTIVIRPRKCPSIDLFSVSLEFLLF